jgi:tetratricopeptide (TPR) repeat protein
MHREGLPLYDPTKRYDDLNEVIFNNTTLTHRGAKLNVFKCTFNPGSNVKSEIGIFKIYRATFNEITFFADHTIPTGNKIMPPATSIAVGFTQFNGNSSNTAVQLINTPSFEIYNNAILEYETGVSLIGSGNSVVILSSNGMQGNKILNCYTGIELFNSVSLFHSNYVFDNVRGINLFNNSYTTFDNTSQPNQVIQNCESIELYASGNSFPTIFRYNQIIDDANLGNTYNDPLIYWDVALQSLNTVQDISLNCWGADFDPEEDLFPYEALIWDPVWQCGGKSGSPMPTSGQDETLYQTGLTYFAEEDYINAEATFKNLVEIYPQSRFAKAVLHELFALEHFTNYDFATLHHYFASISPEHTAIFNTADFLATRCHVKERNWQPAVNWYENRIENPPSYQDSVFAVIDLGEIHLMMEADTMDGAKSGAVHYRLTNIKPKSKQEHETNRTMLLATLPQIKKPQTESPHTPNLRPHPNKKGALGQNIPNPANGVTTINYEIYTEGTVEIRIYNLTGQLIKNLPQGTLAEGKHQTKITVSGMSVGMYHYALFVNGERVDAKKLVVN